MFNFSSSLKIFIGVKPDGTEFSLTSIDSWDFSPSNSESFSYTPTVPGVWKFRAQMQGSYFDWSTYESGSVDTTYTSYKNVTVNTSTSGASPVITHFHGPSGSTYVNETVTLSATATDADGTVDSVQFKVGSTVISTDYEAPFTATYMRSSAGTSTFTAIATDNDGSYDQETTAVTWNGMPSVSSGLSGELSNRWVDVDGDGNLDFVDNLVVVNRDEVSFEDYLMGSAEYQSFGHGSGLHLYHDIQYEENCYYNYYLIYDFIGDFVWNRLFGDKWTWSTWWTASCECDFEIESLSSFMQLYGDHPNRDYQIQTSNGYWSPTWTNAGGLINSGGNGNLSKSLGEWGGVGNLPALVRAVLIARAFGDSGYVQPQSHSIGDEDGDGLPDYEMEVANPEVVSVTNTGIIETVTGKVKQIFKIKIPSGIIVNPTGSGNVVQIQVKSIGEVIFRKTVEYVLTGNIDSIFVEIEGLGSSSLEVIVKYHSEPAVFDMRAAGYASFPFSPDLEGPDPWPYTTFMDEETEDTIGAQLSVNNNYESSNAGIPDSQVFSQPVKFIGGESDIVTVDLAISGIDGFDSGEFRMYPENTSQYPFMVRAWRSGMTRENNNYLFGNGPIADFSATQQTADIMVLPHPNRVAVKIWEMDDSSERDDFIELVNSKAVYLEGLARGEGKLILQYWDEENNLVDEDSVLIKVLRSRSFGVKVGRTDVSVNFGSQEMDALDVRRYDGVDGVIPDAVTPIAFFEESNTLLTDASTHTVINLQNVPCSTSEPEYDAAIQYMILNNLSVLAVSSIEGAYGFAVIGEPRVVIAKAVPGIVFVHEWGHTTGLLHVNSTTNFMGGAGEPDVNNNCIPEWPNPVTSSALLRFVTPVQRDALLQ